MSENAIKSGKRNLVFTIIIAIGVLSAVLNALQSTAVLSLVKTSAGSAYEDDCDQITKAYSLVLTNKITKIANNLSSFIFKTLIPLVCLLLLQFTFSFLLKSQNLNIAPPKNKIYNKN